MSARAVRLVAEVAALLESGRIPDTDAREPDRAPPEEPSWAEQDGAAADELYGREPDLDEAGCWA